MSDLKLSILSLVKSDGGRRVWVPVDFAAFGTRDAIDKTLQRLVHEGDLQRVGRGLYNRPSPRLALQSITPDYRAVIDAIARRDQLRMLVDGATAANDLGLTEVLPTHVTIHTDARRRAVKLGNLVIEFKQAAPSRLYWAGRPAMRVVQALHWIKHALTEEQRLVLRELLADPSQGEAIRKDLMDGFHTLPTWMQTLVRELPGCDPKTALVRVRSKTNRTATAHRSNALGGVA